MVSPIPLLALVGPTGIGKTAVAVRLAAALPVEAISADSRQVYRGMDIGTDKPSPAERARLPHHLLDVVDPDEHYHAARFAREALLATQRVSARGRLPVLVGGTGLYVRALLKGLWPAPPADPGLRAELEAFACAHGTAALHGRLQKADAEGARRVHPNDRIRVVRALEIALLGRGSPGTLTETGNWSAGPSGFRLVMVGLQQARDRLCARLAARASDMVMRGLRREVEQLLDAGYHESLPSMATIGYRQFCAVARGRMSEAEALRLMTRDTVRYAKRQMTWFARDPETRWIDLDRAGGIEGAAEEILGLVGQEGLAP